MNANKGKGCFGIGLKEGNKIVYLWYKKRKNNKMLSLLMVGMGRQSKGKEMMLYGEKRKS